MSSRKHTVIFGTCNENTEICKTVVTLVDCGMRLWEIGSGVLRLEKCCRQMVLDAYRSWKAGMLNLLLWWSWFLKFKKKKNSYENNAGGKKYSQKKIKATKRPVSELKRREMKIVQLQFGRLIFIWFSSYFQNHILHVYIHRSSWNGGRQKKIDTNNRKLQEKLFLLKNAKPYFSSNVT